MKEIKHLGVQIILRIIWIIKGRPNPPALLEMVWPEAKLNNPPCFSLPSGYHLRQFNTDDQKAYFELLRVAGMSPCSLEYWEKHILPIGFFVIEDEANGKLVATCMASHHPTSRHPRAGNFGWLAADPMYKGQNLGYNVAAAVTSRLIAGGYSRIFLETHDFRLPAIKIYLSMGWVPLLYQEDMEMRWKIICEKLNIPFEPEKWSK